MNCVLPSCSWILRLTDTRVHLYCRDPCSSHINFKTFVVRQIVFSLSNRVQNINYGIPGPVSCSRLYLSAQAQRIIMAPCTASLFMPDAFVAVTIAAPSDIALTRTGTEHFLCSSREISPGRTRTLLMWCR